MSDSTPTEPLGAPTAPLPVTPPPAPSGRRTVIILASVGGVLLVALLVLVGVLIGRGSAPEAAPAPTESSTPSATPTESSPTPTPSPSQTEDDDDDDKGPGNGGPGKKDTETSNGAIESFEVSTAKVDCKNASSVPLHFEWEAEGARLWFGVGTDNAKAAPYGSYDLEDEIDIDYQCGQPGNKQIYTVTVELANGDINSATLTIKE
jgi:hypothetical protein